MGIKSPCFHCPGVGWMPTLMLFQRQKHPSPKSFGNFQPAVSLQCPPPSPLLPVHRPIGTLAGTPHSDQLWCPSFKCNPTYAVGKQNSATHFFTRRAPGHFSLLAKGAGKTHWEKFGGGLRHLCNRAPEFQQGGDSIGRWSASKPLPPKSPFPHQLSGPGSGLAPPFTHRHICLKKRHRNKQRTLLWSAGESSFGSFPFLSQAVGILCPYFPPEEGQQD